MTEIPWRKQLLWFVTILASGLLFWWIIFVRGYGTTTLATGPEGGTYAVIGEGLAKASSDNPRIRVASRTSRGSGENLALLERGEVDFAIIQSGVPQSNRIRVVAELYREVLHVLVRDRSEIRALQDLAGKRICLGEEGSGSREVASAVLEHFGVVAGEDVAQSPAKSLALLRQGEVDAVFLVTALHSKMIRDAVAEGELRFLGLGEARKGLASRYPYLGVGEIPAMAYRCRSRPEGAMPDATVLTMSVPSLLVSREALSPGSVYEITKELFASRSSLVGTSPEAYQISEITSSKEFPWPLHDGARRFYRRREPGFLERYAEVIALILSLAATTWALLGTASKWSSRRKKNRIDDYYLEVAAVFLRIEEADLSRDVLREEEVRLRRLRGEAFKDLANERLKADESFRIFQSQVALCLDEVRARAESVKD